MKQLFNLTCIVVVLIVAACSQGGKRANGNDRERTADSIYNYVKSISMTNPQKALMTIDKAEREEKLTDLDVNTLKSMVYNNGIHDYAQAALYARKALDCKSADKNPERQQMLYDNLSSQYYNCGEYAKSMEVADKGIDFAYACGNRKLVAQLMTTIGQCYAQMGITKNAVSCFDRSILILTEYSKELGDWSTAYDLVYAESLKAEQLLGISDYKSLLGMRKKYENDLAMLCRLPEGVKGSNDMLKANFFSVYALAYERTGNEKKADALYGKLMLTDFARTPKGTSLYVAYLIDRKDYKTALERILREEREWKAEGKDTVNYHYSHKILMNKVRALKGLGRYREAINTGMTAYDISDSISRRMKSQNALWLSDQLGKKILRKYISVQDRKLEMNSAVIFSVSLLLLVCIILLLLLWRSNRLIKNKNRKASALIGDLLRYRAELYARMPEAKRGVEPIQQTGGADGNDNNGTGQTDGEADCQYSQYLRIEKTVFDRKLFVRYRLSKDEVADAVGMSISYFNRLFAKYSSLSFNNYINDLRMDYAAKLLKENPNYSIEAIAQECGVAVRQTFYRLFVKKFGMTPAEYRRSVE